ncbi:DUF948 domain-containing protein [Neobacillus mesonae]|nr:DUF948 domain-containing protein [Neobacillus mesonae]
MIAWSVALVAGAFVVMAAVIVVVLIEVKAFMKQVKQSIKQLEARTNLLVEDTSVMLKETNKAISDMHGHIEKCTPLFESAASAGKLLQTVSRTIDDISDKLTRSAHKHVLDAHQDNELRLGQMFRYFDAALTVWHSWHRFSHAPGEAVPREKE